MALMAKAACQAGAVGIRANGVQDIRDIMREMPLPVIGIIKKITPAAAYTSPPTLAEVDALVETGCDIIALDFTRSRQAPRRERKGNFGTGKTQIPSSAHHGGLLFPAGRARGAKRRSGFCGHHPERVCAGDPHGRAEL